MTSQFLVSTSGALVSEPVLQQLEKWNRDAGRAFSEATRKAYNSDFASFTAWCGDPQLRPLPAAPETVAAYLRAEASCGRALATVKRRAAAITKAHKAAKLPNPCDSEEVRLALREVARDRKGVGQKQAGALNQREADRIAIRLEKATRPRDLRDLALVLVGRDLMARASELASVTAEDISWPEADGPALVMLLRSKTDDEKKPLAIGPDAAEALRCWLQAAQITAGPVFRAITKGGRVKNKAITRRDIGRIVKQLAGDGFSAHSLRIGMTQDLVAANTGTAAIMEVAGWSSEAMVTRYARRLNASRGAIAQYYARRK